MESTEATTASYVEEAGVLKRIRTASRNRERASARDRLDDRLSELFQPGCADLVRLPRGLSHKTQLLKHDVQEMVWMQAHAAQFSKLPAQCGQVWLQRLSGNPDDACRIRDVVRSPMLRIVAPVGRGLAPLERLPHPLEGNGQPVHEPRSLVLALSFDANDAEASLAMR